MKVLLASSEVYPYSKTGGLADMVGALGKALASAGHRVGIVTPLYTGIRERIPELKPVDLPIDFPLGAARVRGEIWSHEPSPGLTIYFIEQPDFYQRSTLYQVHGRDYPDNAERFIFFAKVAAHLALHLDWKPEILHVHDWQAAPAALLLHHQRKLPGWENAPRTCLTIHNLAYQGVFPAFQYALLNLPWDYFNPAGVEFYSQINYLKAGIAYADTLTTVSPRYAREITTEEYGCGLEGLLRNRAAALVGILNGVDYGEWDPEKDPHIPEPYSAALLERKTTSKIALQKQFGLAQNPEIPLFGNIGRLAHQKGVDILLDSLEEMLSAEMQFVLLGSGLPEFERGFRELASRHPSRASVHIGFDEAASHLVEAGSDFFLMPSRFEPCGLNQMYSLRYGTVPIVRITGGLDDTVIDIKEDPEHANGIKFAEYTSRALAKSIRKGLVLYGEKPLFRHYQKNGMTGDFSWTRTAGDYVKVYESALAVSP